MHSNNFDGGGFNQWVLDDTGGQLRTRLATSSAGTQLNLGYLVQQAAGSAQRGAYRGTGFELRTDAWAVVRGGEGVLMSATARAQQGSSVTSTRLDSGEAIGLLRAAGELRPIGTEVMTRSAAGNPVHGVTVECPNPEDLKLLANAKYRDVIIAASKRSGFSPQAIAAIMNAEAATLTYSVQIPVVNRKIGKPAVDKAGKPIFKTTKKNDGEWDVHSASPKSSARGMTQFLDGIWIGMMFAADSFLNTRAKKEGWLTTRSVHVKKKSDKDELTSLTVQAFKLVNGKFFTKTARRALAQVLSSKPYVMARATASDANLQKLLDLRYEPEYAINTAVNYGNENLKALKGYGFKIDGISDGDKAKLIYLTHHLGSGDAKSFTNNTIGHTRAKVLLDAQVGTAKSAQYAADNGDSYVKGHRACLCTFVDNCIKLSEKMCDPSKTAAMRTLLDVTVAVR